MALSASLREALNHAFRAQHDTGPQSGPGRAAMRGLLLDGTELGFADDDLLQLLNPYYFKGINDPYGRGLLLEDWSQFEFAAQIAYAAGCTKQNARVAQANWFAAFPGMLAAYEELADGA